MCTILLAWRHLAAAPIVLAANRDELIARRSLPPHVLRESPLIAGGQDALAGGTWLAVRADGVVAAVTNRRSDGRDPTRRSRGELPLALLERGPGSDADADARKYLSSLHPNHYNPFNALYASPSLALVAHARDDDTLDLHVLEPGLHVLTIHDLDDLGQIKVAALTRMFRNAAGAAGDDPARLLAGMETVLEEHGEPGREGIDVACVHGDVYGTVSSSSVLVDAAGGIVYRHAPGPPDVTPREDVSQLLRATSAQRRASG